MSWDLSREEVQEIKFIIDSEQIKDYEKSYYINPDEIYNIFIFVFNQNIREKLQTIFITYGLEVSAISEETHTLTPEIIKEMNEQTLILFSDPDFINLINIYKRKPELFNLLSNYIQNNDVVIESLISNKNIDQLSEEDKLYYTKLSIKIMDFGFKIPQETIIDRLIKYSGHLNLTIRSFFNDN
jgi:predicted nuclease of predicted toxin-antitoxin system